MFFRLVGRNLKRARRENGIYFSSLIVAIVAFYIVLSLKQQDVVVYLLTLEHAQTKALLSLIRTLYLVSLVITFFLIFYASKYQLERRSYSLGIYMLLGMKRAKVFGLFMAEDLGSSLFSLAVGLPVAVLLSELIGLVTSKLVGMSIIGHRFSVSMSGIVMTVVGVVMIKALSAFVLSGRLVLSQLGDTLGGTGSVKPHTGHIFLHLGQLFLAVPALAVAYYASITKADVIPWITRCILILSFGTLGTFLLVRALVVVFSLIIRKKGSKKLSTFSFRQLQENVLDKPNLLAVSVLLMSLALLCFAGSILSGTAVEDTKPGRHALDFTMQAKESLVRRTMESKRMKRYVGTYFPVSVGCYEAGAVDLQSLKGAIEAVDTMWTDKIEGYLDMCCIINESGYNGEQRAMGQPEVELGDHEIALFKNSKMTEGNVVETLLADVVKAGIAVKISGEDYQFSRTLYTEPFVASTMPQKEMEVNTALILPDALFDHLVLDKGRDTIWSGSFRTSRVKEEGLMQVTYAASSLMQAAGITNRTTYLQGKAKGMFHMIAACYTMLYIGLLFMIIANVTVGLQFLSHQAKSADRYRTLIRLGCDQPAIAGTSNRQVSWYFGLVIAVASLHAAFGLTFIADLFGLASEAHPGMHLLAAGAFAAGLLILIEGIYIHVIKRAGARYIRHLDSGVYRE